MSKSTQAHLPRRIKKGGLDARTKQQMEYYMGAKLLEVGVDPQSDSVTYRWSARAEGEEEVWTYSAYWGDSRQKLLAGNLDVIQERQAGEPRPSAFSPTVLSGIVIGAAILIFLSFLFVLKTF